LTTSNNFDVGIIDLFTDFVKTNECLGLTRVRR
jgi:hypothetical protein